MTNLTSAELAAWVQAVGSVLAILAAALIAIWQSRAQHRSAMQLHRAEKRQARVELSKTLSVLAKNCSKAVAYGSGRLSDRETIHRIAEGDVHFDLGELRRVDNAIAGIPLHSLPDTLVTSTMILSATVRQFTEKTEMALHLHRKMDAAAFEDLFRTFGEINESLKKTCEEIEAEVERVQNQK
jgi:hypothetical protein